MLKITIPEQELFDESQSRFIKMEGGSFEIEHSLSAIAKWEAKWGTQFLSKTQKTVEESLDYIRCMTVTPDVNPDLYFRISNEIMKQINDYIESKQTATTIRRMGAKKPNREIVTSEVIYYWMVAANIPPEYDKWHLNRLLTLIEVYSVKSGPQEKMGRREILAQQRALNESRKAAYKTRG